MTSSWQAFAFNVKLCGLRLYVISAPWGLIWGPPHLFIVWCCLPSLSKVGLHVDFHPLPYFSLKGHSLTLSGGEEATFKTWLRCWSSTNIHSGALWCTRRTLGNHSGVRRYGRSKGTHLHCLRSYHRSYPATGHTSELHQPCVFVSTSGFSLLGIWHIVACSTGLKFWRHTFCITEASMSFALLLERKLQS